MINVNRLYNLVFNTRHHRYISVPIRDVSDGAGVGDDSTIIQSTIDDAGENGVLFFPPITYRIENTLSCPYDGQTWLMFGATILVDFSGVGIELGQVANVRTRQISIYGGYVVRAGMEAGVSSWAAGEVGVRFANTNFCKFDGFRIEGFNVGLELLGSDANGQAYFTGIPLRIRGCKTAIRFYAQSGGWCNENTIMGNGSLSLASSDPDATGAYQVVLDHDVTSSVLNGNKVRDVSIESAKATGKPAGAIYANCQSCLFEGVRYEGFDSPFIIAGADWQNGGNTFLGGRGLSGPSVVDTALANEKFILLGDTHSHIGGGSSTAPLLTLREVNSSNNVQFRIKDASGTTRLESVGSGGLAIGSGGTRIVRHLSGSKTWDPGEVASGAQTTTTLTVTNAQIGNPVRVGFSQDLQGMVLSGYISAASTGTVVLRNDTGGPIDLASGTLRMSVDQY